MSKGFLISFEGGEACGKSTQIKLFENYLKSIGGGDFLLTREPGGTEVGEKIRNILLHDKSDLSAETEFLLFSASRSKLVQDVLKPALENGKIVVLDRFFDSSFCYQGYAGNLQLNDLETITKFATGGLVPDMTVLLDISYEDGMARKSKDENLKNLDRMELKGKTYHDKVRAGYLKLAEREPNRIFVVDAVDSIENIHNKIVAEFERRYKK